MKKNWAGGQCFIRHCSQLRGGKIILFQPFDLRFLNRILLVLLVLQILAGQSEAGGIGRPVASGQVRTFTSIKLDYESLELDIDSDQSAFQGESREERILLTGVYGLSPFVDLTLRIGLVAHETPSRNFNGSLGPAYGAGAKWTFYQKNDLSVGMGIQILEFWTEDKDSKTSELKWDEVDAYVGGILEGFERMTPYFGLLFTIGRGKFKNGPTIDLESFADLFVGAKFHVHKNFYFISEARLIHENGLTFSLRYAL